MKKIFFEKNALLIEQLSKYAPSDDQLLSVPLHVNLVDPFLLCMLKLGQDPRKNNFLVGMNLLTFLQSINCTLSKVLAAHRYLLDNREKPRKSGLNQAEIDFEVYTDANIIEEYKYSLRQFVSMLKVAVDQLILLLTTNPSENTRCDCIATFLEKIKKMGHNNFDMKFLTGLNVAANYLKHHPYQFEASKNVFYLREPSLLIMANKKNKKGKDKEDYRGLKRFFVNELTDHGDYVSFVICYSFLVNGFNSFYEQTLKLLGNVQPA